ncbi:glycosyl transferase group 1 [Chlorella sorokiniana]|uniref:Glycosyl transferase group 1 n=1 Tax=Chlorella sorokiniana TaxID=3076 RepID=A0A2P6TLE5_CHLSO|nr:glycosyl transferase group 1 [Chlorella sorokiniana]|eukprot:PRW45111.1 glycosyl transferase group 1 [Chlorella sorokiniana]
MPWRAGLPPALRPTPDGRRPPPPLLPFGATLHYAGCGCPYSWAPGCRLCDWGDSWLQQAYASLLPKPGAPVRLSPIRPLKVAFCIPHHNVTGGLKMLLEQMRLLKLRGHHIVALTRSDTANTAVPPWSDVQADEGVVCRQDQRFRDVYNVDSCDVVITGIFHQVPEWLTSCAAPVLYYEQGHEWLFGDPARFREGSAAAAQDSLFHQVMHLPVALAAVSEGVHRILSSEFARSSLLIHNGVDCQRFCPGPRSTAVPSKVLPEARSASSASTAQPCGCSPAAAGACGGTVQAQMRGQWQAQWLGQPAALLPPLSPQDVQQQQAQQQQQQQSVLLVGNPGLCLKGFECAVATLARVQRSRPIQVIWICQQEPTPEVIARLAAAGLHVRLFIDPPQGALPELYRGHDCLLFTSKYEAWGMPVLEAMASGLAVVATETAGVCSFATHNVDCLLAPYGDTAELAQHVLSVLEDASLRARLGAAGRQTALEYSPDRVAEQLERVLYAMTACRQELLALRLQALPDAQRTQQAAAQACAAVFAEQAAIAAAMQASKQRECSPTQQAPGGGSGSQASAAAQTGGPLHAVPSVGSLSAMSTQVSEPALAGMPAQSGPQPMER